jgi:PAS domain-containing protein
MQGCGESIRISDEIGVSARARTLHLNEPMSIPHIFLRDPLAGAAVLLCLATICWCIRVIRRRQRGADRFLLGLLGLIAICQALRIFKCLGVWTASEPFHRLDDFVNLATGGLYLIGALLLEISSRDRISAELSLRLLQANPGKQPGSLHEASRAVLVLANDGRIVACNQAAERILGRRLSQIIGAKPILERRELPSATEASKAKNPGGTAVEA